MGYVPGGGEDVVSGRHDRPSREIHKQRLSTMRSTIKGAPGANFVLADSPAKATPRTSSKPQVHSEGAGVDSW